VVSEDACDVNSRYRFCCEIFHELTFSLIDFITDAIKIRLSKARGRCRYGEIRYVPYE